MPDPTDTDILNWLEEHLYQIWHPAPASGYLMVEYVVEGETGLYRQTAYGKGLRGAVRKAMQADAEKVRP